MDYLDISQHEHWFTEYATDERARENGDATPIDLKIAHTFKVLKNAQRIVEGEDFPLHLHRACLLASLYHDVARFEQYLNYHTFRDRDSIDHGRMGVKILKQHKRLLGEASPVPHIVMAAVGLHNRFALPPHLPRETEIACQIVRDADKLDIIRVMDEHLSGPKPYNPTVILRLPDDPALGNPGVAEAVVAGRVAAYADLRSVNDFRLLLGTWFYDMHFEGSRRQFIEDGHAKRLLEGLPDSAMYGRAKRYLLDLLGANSPF